MSNNRDRMLNADSGTRNRGPDRAGRPIPSSRHRQIADLAGQGMTSREIAEKLGISHSRVCRIARQYLIQLARARSRHFAVYINRRNAELLQQLAEAAGISPTAMMDRCVRAIVDDGIEQARRRLGLPQPSSS